MSRLLLVLAFAGVALAQKSPEETVKSMTVADGLQVELFAAEPMLLNPTSIDVDHLGRVWVCEAVNYRNKMFKKPLNRTAGDRIQVLTDKDGDGKADEAITFYQGPELYGPLGIAIAASPKDKGFTYKVFVCQSPDILLFDDADGDGKADGPPKKFLTGFGGFDHDHGVHGINIGPDGKLYFTVGDSGVKGLQAADGKGPTWTTNDKDVQKGTVWRCDMDGKNLELIAHNFRNNYEACVNSFGEVWLSDNDDDGNQQTRICHVMPGGNYGYGPRGPGQTHWHEEQPGIVHKTMRTGFGSPTGICFYEGSLLPERFRGQLLHTDAGPRELRAFHIKAKGAGYELTKENMVTSTDNWFRLSDVCVAPDGSLMLADWYDPGVGGHGMGDTTRGRIYRVTPKGHKGYKVPEVRLETTNDRWMTLNSPCLATREVAFNSMRSWERETANAFFDEMYTKPTLENSWQTGRLWQATLNFLPIGLDLDRQDRITAVAKYFSIEAMINSDMSEHEDASSVAAMFERSLADMTESGRLLPKDMQRQLKHLGKPGWLQAAREVLLGIRNSTAEQAKPVFYSLAKLYDGQDIFYRAALNIACGTEPERRKAILADFDKHFPEWNDKVADLVWELRPASAVARLPKLLEDEKLTPAQKGRIVDILAANDDPAVGQTMLTLLGRETLPEIKAKALENLKTFLPTKWKDLAKSDDFKKVLDGLIKDAKSRTVGLQLVAIAGHTGAIDQIAELIGSGESMEARKEAIRTLGRLQHPKAIEALSAVLSAGRDAELSLEAITAFGMHAEGKPEFRETQESLKTLQGLIVNKGVAPELQRAAVKALAGSRAGTAWLLQTHERKQLPEAIVADAGKLLRNSPFQGERNKALILFPAGGKLDPKKLPPITELVKRTGDVKRGEAVLAASLKNESQCLRCHTVRGVGGNIGPDQSIIGKKASRENLYESILLPSKAIADQYVQWRVDTNDQRTVTGLLVAESATSVTLRDANGKDHTFATKDLDGPKQKSLVSIMPDNLVAAMTEDDLIDLVEYLLTLKTASISPETWNILGPFENFEDGALDKDLGVESDKAIDLAKQHKGRDGVMRWGTVRTTGTGYLDLAAYYARKGANTASYLYQVIESPIDQDGTLLIGNDDGAKIWINGVKAFENRDHFAATPERHRVPVKLKKGPNAVLIKIVNGDDPHGLYFALTSGEELKLSK